MKISYLLIITLLFCSCIQTREANQTESQEMNKTNITIDINAEKYLISPYIYGINDNDGFEGVTATAIRQGGNRYTAYNWENNFSNAGSDWHHSSDTYLSSSNIPADMANKLITKAAARNIPYRIVTLQMAGFVSADKNGNVSEAQTAPSNRWIPVQFAKGSAFSFTPNLNDGVVYMDEFVNHLVQKYGDAASGNGINGYSLDNEPALWAHTHPRVHPQKLTVANLINRSIALSKAVKAVDPASEIFGPALYGFKAFLDLQEAPDWNTIKTQNRYSWFLDAYLDEMRKAETENGKRLLDVLDVHYYSEARGLANGLCRITDCTNNAHTSCNNARIQAPRTLWEPGYFEDSWIAQWNKTYLPILPKIKKSIDDYYPETKLAITEYGFGGNTHISGAIAQADALGIFGREGVYLAALWHSANNSFPNAAINIFTNYDGKGSSFGNIGIKINTNNRNELYSVYASLNNENNLTIIVINKSESNKQEVTVNIENKENYTTASPFMISAEGAFIKKENSIPINNGSFKFIMPAMSVVMFAVE